MGFLDKLRAKISSSSSSSPSSPPKKTTSGNTDDLGSGPRRYVPRTYASANTADTSDDWTPPGGNKDTAGGVKTT